MLVTYPTWQPMGEGARVGRNKTPSPPPQIPQAELPMPTRSRSAFVLSIIFIMIIINYKCTHFSDRLLTIVNVDLSGTFPMTFWKRHLKKHIFNHLGFSALERSHIKFLDSLVPESWLTEAPHSLRKWTQKCFSFFKILASFMCRGKWKWIISLKNCACSVIMKCTRWQCHLFAFVLVPDPLKELFKPAQNSNNGLTNDLRMADQRQPVRCILKTCPKRDTLLTLVAQKWHISTLIKHKKWMLVKCEGRSNGVLDKISGEGLNNTVAKRHRCCISNLHPHLNLHSESCWMYSEEF